MNLSEFHTEYKFKSLDEKAVSSSPIEQFAAWFNKAVNASIQYPNAMTLATASKDGVPSGRIVLLKSYDENGFVFFSNYESKKGVQLSENPHAALLFFWQQLERQVRITGNVEKLPESESDKYFSTRLPESQLSALASPQSKEIRDRAFLIARINELKLKYTNKPIPRPSQWGGYILKPYAFEFWQGRENRLHDRIEYLLDGNEWKIRRLAP